jgi:hypothetical protein
LDSHFERRLPLEEILKSLKRETTAVISIDQIVRADIFLRESKA